MAAHKGHPKYGGRAKGTPNRSTSSVKAALQEAFDKLGGVPALVRWGKEQPGEFYKIYARLVPTEVKASLEVSSIGALLDEARARRLKALEAGEVIDNVVQLPRG